MILILCSICGCIGLVLLLRLYYVLSSLKEKSYVEKKAIKVLAIAGSGGHTTELIRLMSSLPSSFTPRAYVMATTDRMSLSKIQCFEEEHQSLNAGVFEIHRIPRSREVRQSWLSTVWTTLYAVAHSIPLLWSIKPDLILCNGPGTCIPICFISFLFKVMGLAWTDIVFVESICRVTSMSMTGKLLYPIANKFYVQWPTLVKDYPNALYLGGRIV